MAVDVIADAVGAPRATAGVERPRVVALECRGLRRRFGALEAVRGISFEIREGETYGLLGPNGAGKTTTISIVCGLLEADAGTVTVAGRPMTTRSVAAKASAHSTRAARAPPASP